VRDLTKRAMIRGHTPCRLREIVPDRVKGSSTCSLFCEMYATCVAIKIHDILEQ
jgi:hypothetical protein